MTRGDLRTWLAVAQTILLLVAAGSVARLAFDHVQGGRPTFALAAFGAVVRSAGYALRLRGGWAVILLGVLLEVPVFGAASSALNYGLIEFGQLALVEVAAVTVPIAGSLLWQELAAHRHERAPILVLIVVSASLLAAASIAVRCWHIRGLAASFQPMALRGLGTNALIVVGTLLIGLRRPAGWIVLLVAMVAPLLASPSESLGAHIVLGPLLAALDLAQWRFGTKRAPPVAPAEPSPVF